MLPSTWSTRTPSSRSAVRRDGRVLKLLGGRSDLAVVREDTAVTPHRRLEVAGSAIGGMEVTGDLTDRNCGLSPSRVKFLQGPSLGIEEYLCLELDI